MDNFNYIDKIKKLAIISLFSDDEFMDIFVLKGGSALEIIYNISDRSSLDIDFSIESEFDNRELDTILSFRTAID